MCVCVFDFSCTRYYFDVCASSLIPAVLLLLPLVVVHFFFALSPAALDCCFWHKRHISSEFPLVCSLLHQFYIHRTQHTQYNRYTTRNAHTIIIATTIVSGRSVKKPLANNSMSMNILEFYTIIIEPNYKLVQSDMIKKEHTPNNVRVWSRKTSLVIYVLAIKALCQPNNCKQFIVKKATDVRNCITLFLQVATRFCIEFHPFTPYRLVDSKD